MKLTEKRMAILRRLSDGRDHLLAGGDLISARGMKQADLLLYRGTNHYRITPAGRAALEKERE